MTKFALHKEKTTDSGFALLLTLVIVSIILAVGLSLLNTTLKQLTLSTLGRDSEVAFHAANTGQECIQYHRAQPPMLSLFLNEDADPATNAPPLECAGGAQILSSTNHVLDASSNKYVYNYTYQHNMGTNACMQTSLYLLDIRGASSDIVHTVNEGLQTVSCTAGNVCTIIFSRGFNRPCDSLDSILTVQRELTVQF